MDDRVVEDYRRHQLIAAAKGSTFVGKAWKDELSVLDAQGSSIVEVISALKTGVDQLFVDRAKANSMPEVQRYVDALKKIMPSLSDGHLAMLKAHCRAPNRCLTATQLADAAGYANYSAANLQYGFVGKLLWEELPTKLPMGNDGNPTYTFALADAGDRSASEEQWVWQMRPEVAAAIKELALDV